MAEADAGEGHEGQATGGLPPPAIERPSYGRGCRAKVERRE